MSEYLYHVDEKDEVLGSVERSEAHSKKLLHRAGVVFVFNSKNEVFLTKRSAQKRIFPNCFDCVCSFHVSYGESYEESAQRELYEETRIKGKPDYLGKFIIDEDPDHLIVAVYRIHYDGEIKLDPGEAINGKFYTQEEADKIINNQKTTNWLIEAWKIYKENLK